MALMQARFMVPQPSAAATVESRRDKYRAATAGTPPVRAELSRLADMRQSGSPVSLSLSCTVRTERGRPRLGLAWFEPYHLRPHTSNRPPRYPGMATNRRSGPATGMLGNLVSLGNTTPMPWLLWFA